MSHDQTTKTRPPLAHHRASSCPSHCCCARAGRSAARRARGSTRRWATQSSSVSGPEGGAGGWEGASAAAAVVGVGPRAPPPHAAAGMQGHPVHHHAWRPLCSGWAAIQRWPGEHRRSDLTYHTRHRTHLVCDEPVERRHVPPVRRVKQQVLVVRPGRTWTRGTGGMVDGKLPTDVKKVMWAHALVTLLPAAHGNGLPGSYKQVSRRAVGWPPRLLTRSGRCSSCVGCLPPRRWPQPALSPPGVGRRRLPGPVHHLHHHRSGRRAAAGCRMRAARVPP